MDTIQRLWADPNRRRSIAAALAIQALMVLLAYRGLAKADDAEVRGPRWLWRLVIPASVTWIREQKTITIPAGSLAWFVIGRRRS